MAAAPLNYHVPESRHLYSRVTILFHLHFFSWTFVVLPLRGLYFSQIFQTTHARASNVPKCAQNIENGLVNKHVCIHINKYYIDSISYNMSQVLQWGDPRETRTP